MHIQFFLHNGPSSILGHASLLGHTNTLQLSLPTNYFLLSEVLCLNDVEEGDRYIEMYLHRKFYDSIEILEVSLLYSSTGRYVSGD